MQTWFITGASGGLASRLTRRLLDRGARVAATVRKPGVLADLQLQYGSRLWQANLDLTNAQQIAEVVERAFLELCLSIMQHMDCMAQWKEASDKQIEHQFMTNVLGSLRAARAVLPFFRKQGSGHIVQISSMAGHYSIPGMGLYCSSKWAVEGAFEALAKEVAPFNIKTTMVEPGGIRTNFLTSNAVFGERMDEYRDTEADQFVSLMKGELPGIDMSMFNQMVVGDPDKMAHQIIRRVDQGEGPIRMALGSDAYDQIRTAFLDRLAALEAQKELAYSTDSDDVVKPL